MAEIAAGAVAYEAASTVVEGGVVAGIALAKSTQPLYGTFTRFAVAPDGDGRSSLARSKHTATVLHGKLYVFGGETAPTVPATNDMHILSLPGIDTSSTEPEYRCIPAVPMRYTEKPPTALIDHEACAIGDSIFFFNGSTPEEAENLRIWRFDSLNLKWKETSLAENEALATRIGSGDRSVLPKSDRLLIASTQDATYVLDQTHDHIDTLYLLDSHEEGAVFKTIRFPSVVEAGQKQLLPRARKGAKIVPITTGHGRNYLLLLPGIAVTLSSADTSEAEFLPDIWALQLPSTPSSASAVKDSARDTLDASVLGGDSGTFSWAQVEIEARNEELGSEGKSLPGPISFYAADAVPGTGEIVLWGGVDAKGESSGEGWILKVR